VRPPRTARERMVAELREAGIRDERVLAAMAAVPRERFVPEAFRGRAYASRRVPLGLGQTMSLPWTVARLAELLGAPPGSRVLEIGTGSGYQAAVLAEMGLRVYTLERHARLARQAARILRELGYLSVTVKHFDGTFGWAAEGPWRGIVATAAGPRVPRVLVDQLAVGGRLVLPVAGAGGEQRLLVVTRLPGGRTRREDAGPASFVPLVGRYGWQEPGQDPGRGREA